MRKMMTKEVTKTTLKLAKMVIDENGNPQVEVMEDLEVVGALTMEKAQKLVAKTFSSGVTVFEIETSTETYEMAIEKFLEHATVKVKSEEQE